jgi:hypothetical protein
MIINSHDTPRDISFRWREIPAFGKSRAGVFYFREVSTRVEWRGGSSLGFWVGDVPAHGSLVMVVREGERGEEGEEGREERREWAELKWRE